MEKGECLQRPAFGSSDFLDHKDLSSTAWCRSVQLWQLKQPVFKSYNLLTLWIQASHLILTSGFIYRLRLLYSPRRLCESQFQDFLMLVVLGIWLDSFLLCVCRWGWGLPLVLQDVQQCCRLLPIGCQHQPPPQAWQPTVSPDIARFPQEIGGWWEITPDWGPTYIWQCVWYAQNRVDVSWISFSFPSLMGLLKFPIKYLYFLKKKLCLRRATSQWMFNLRYVGFFCLFVLVWFFFFLVSPTWLSTTALFKNINYQCKGIIVKIFQWWGLGSHKCCLWRKKKKKKTITFS